MFVTTKKIVVKKGVSLEKVTCFNVEQRGKKLDFHDSCQW